MIPARDVLGELLRGDTYKDVLAMIDTSPTANTSLHYDFLVWVKANHTMGEASLILEEFVIDGMYPEEFLKQWRLPNER